VGAGPHVVGEDHVGTEEDIVLAGDSVEQQNAAREAERYGWTTDDELLLYVIHGCLHLVGHDDRTPEDRAAMRAAETRHLAEFGLKHRFDE
jgi:probable rRNA maturation factor